MPTKTKETEVEREPRPGDGVLRVMDATGDTEIRWDPNDYPEIQAAEAKFKRFRKKGYTAYAVGAGGKKGQIITEFDPGLGEIILTPPVAGG